MSNQISDDLRLEIARIEWYTACANHELAKYGEWQANWAEPVRLAEERINAIVQLQGVTVLDSSPKEK